MKRIIVMSVLCFGFCQFSYAQTPTPTFNEWFKQKKTQIKYLLEQIALLKVYIGYARQGYEIAHKGLDLIHKIKKGDFDLHETYITSLKAVNPRIKNYVKVAAAIALQARIVKQSGSALSAMRASGEFTPDEIRYAENVIERLLTDCLDCINELYRVITADELELKDDERINRIDRLYADMQNKYSFCATFNDQIGVLTVQRKAERAEINYSKILNQIP